VADLPLKHALDKVLVPRRDVLLFDRPLCTLGRLSQDPLRPLPGRLAIARLAGHLADHTLTRITGLGPIGPGADRLRLCVPRLRLNRSRLGRRLALRPATTRHAQQLIGLPTQTSALLVTTTRLILETPRLLDHPTHVLHPARPVGRAVPVPTLGPARLMLARRVRLLTIGRRPIPLVCLLPSLSRPLFDAGLVFAAAARGFVGLLAALAARLLVAPLAVLAITRRLRSVLLLGSPGLFARTIAAGFFVVGWRTVAIRLVARLLFASGLFAGLRF
jgi:hypothetical protein